MVAAILVWTITSTGALADSIEVGSGANQADVFIEFGDGARFEFDVSFDGSTTGLGLFDIIEAETSVQTVRSTFGSSVFIDGIIFEGHSNVGFGGDENWWHYWVRDSGSADWTFASFGPSDRVVNDGDADGWVYGRFGPPVPEPVSAGLLGLTALAATSRRRRHEP